MTKAKTAAKPAAAPEEPTPDVVDATSAPFDVTEPPAEALEPVSNEAPKELMQTAGITPPEDPRPLAVIASSLETKATKGKTLFVTKSKDQAVEILANGSAYAPISREGVYVWAVAEADVEMFSKHVHVQHGRIVQAVGK